MRCHSNQKAKKRKIYKTKIKIIKKEQPKLFFFSFLYWDFLITRAGLPARTTLSPKDLVITAPAPATTLLPSVTRKDNDATSSPEIVTDGDGLAVFDP